LAQARRATWQWRASGGVGLLLTLSCWTDLWLWLPLTDYLILQHTNQVVQ